MIRVSFLGAAGEVTGSCYLVETSRARILVDFGMHQGEVTADEHNHKYVPPDCDRLNAVVLTHAHLDHCGRLPMLEKHGYAGPIYSTPASCALTGIVLRDSASLQEADAEDENRRLAPGQRPFEPLYTVEDTNRVLDRLAPIGYTRRTDIAPGISIKFFDAGHIIGAASIHMTIDDGSPGAARRTIVFSGDVGVKGAPILRDPVVPTPINGGAPDLVILESTYGDRDHRPLNGTIDELVGILASARAANGKVLIPAFAIGRTQDLVYHLGCLQRDGRIPPTNVYIDSPMATAASRLYDEHPELFDSDAAALRLRGIDPLKFPGLRYTSTRDESKSLNDLRGGGVVIAGSGMATGGRIVHHLRHSLPNPSTHVVIVGFQGRGTLGRRLVEGAKEVRIFNTPVQVGAEIHTLGGFSAHAGQSGLVEWGRRAVGGGASSRPRIVLTHGEDPQRNTLAEKLLRATGIRAELPQFGDSVTL